MPVSVEQSIYRALSDHLRTWTLPAGWTFANNVAFPGLNYTPAANRPFVSFEHHVNRSIETDLSLEMDPIRQGFIRLNVMWPLGVTHDTPLGVAATLREHFRRGTKLYKDGVQVRIDEDPEIASFITGTSHVTLPVTVRWRSYPNTSA